MNEVKEKIRSFLINDLEVDINELTDSQPMFTSGLIDSFSLIELLSFLESELGYIADFSELDVNDLDTIDSIASLVTLNATSQISAG